MLILVADDEEIIHQLLDPFLTRLGHECVHASDGIEALAQFDGRRIDLAFVDVRMPRMDGLELLESIRRDSPSTLVAMITGHGELEVAVSALKAGAWDFLNKPIRLDDIEAVLARVDTVRGLEERNRRLRDAIGGIQSAEALRESNRRMIGSSPATERVRNQVQEAVDGMMDTILLTGETGVGKEVVAREIHFLAESEETPFIAVNCPALADNLLEAELFGHVRGAFTGADQSRPGYFERANGGTLLLDEVGDLSPNAQAALLRVIETRTVVRVGGSEEHALELRIIAATNQDLERAVLEGRFRRDLLFRLNPYAIEVPPLRDRREDIIPLAEHFIEQFAAPRNLGLSGLSDDARSLLLSYDYPGNIRELRNIVERSCVKARSGAIEPRHLAIEPSTTSDQQTVPHLVDGDERSRILDALERTKWNRRQAARELGYTYAKLRYWMGRYGIR